MRRTITGEIEVPSESNRRVKYIRNIDRIPDIPPEERAVLKKVVDKYVFRANDHYLSLIDWSDPADPINPTLVTNIGGYSAGITFDTAGNLYAGNGFDAAGPSDTGWIKAFPFSAWAPALTGGPPADFEASGTLIADLLSASTLGFDAEGNLHVGGGDLYGGSDDNDYAGLVRSTSVAAALSGGGPADPFDLIGKATSIWQGGDPGECSSYQGYLEAFNSSDAVEIQSGTFCPFTTPY